MKIKSISYLNQEGDTRKRSKCINGKFLMLEVRVTNGRIRKNRAKYTAMQMVTHPQVEDRDQVLTLDDDTKLRVYQSGDPTQMVVQAHGTIEIHDKEYAPKTEHESLDFSMDDMFYIPDYN